MSCSRTLAGLKRVLAIVCVVDEARANRASREASMMGTVGTSRCQGVMMKKWGRMGRGGRESHYANAQSHLYLRSTEKSSGQVTRYSCFNLAWTCIMPDASLHVTTITTSCTCSQCRSATSHVANYRSRVRQLAGPTA